MTQQRSFGTPLSTNRVAVRRACSKESAVVVSTPPPARDEELVELCDVLEAADLLHDALTSHKKSRRGRRLSLEPDSPQTAWVAPLALDEDEEDATPAGDGWGSTMASLRVEVRERLLSAMLRLINTADADRLKEILAGIGPIRAQKICDARDLRGEPFLAVEDALATVGLSPKQAENLIIANMRQILDA